MKRVLLLSCAFLAALMMLAQPLAAAPKPAKLFSDHMVLQQGREIPVWGSATAGEKIAVTLGAHTRTTIAGADGHWSVKLPVMNAGGPFTMTVDGSSTLQFRDVMIGEVWLASGQSNMTFPLASSEGADKELATADVPDIRLFIVPRKIALEPQSDIGAGSWQLCTPDTAREFSAVGYYFARELQRKLKVPVGIIESAWPGTAAEEWTGAEALGSEADFAPILQRWDAGPSSVRELAHHALPFSLAFDDFELLPNDSSTPPVSLSNFEDGFARSSLGGNWAYDWKAGAASAFALVQPGRGASQYATHVSGMQDGTESSRLELRFKPDGSPVDFGRYAGIRFWVRGTGHFRVHTLQPTVADFDNYGTDIVRATQDWQPVTVWFKDLKQAGWGVQMPFTQDALTGLTIDSSPLQDAQRPPSGLYNGMIAPLVPYAMRGALWYQGEGNAWRAYQYRKLLPALVGSWRKTWGQGDFPFLTVQLPNFGSRPAEPSDAWWAELREAQLMTLNLPNTGLAVTIDVGEAGNVHPHKKREVGDRLALWALGTTYGKNIVYSGPLYNSMQINGDHIRISFKNSGGGLHAREGGPLKGFAIAAADRKYHWANATVDGDTVIVSSPDVQAPVAVRYAWAGDPECDLVNSADLPASPFRTDKWPGITEGHN